MSGPGLVLYGLTMTFATIDWVMSLQARWFSTIFAAVFGIGQVLAALSFSIAVLTLLATQPPLRRDFRSLEDFGSLGTPPPLRSLISVQVCRDLGNLLLTVVMFWAYTAFCQFLLIWAGNVPEEIAWYVPRFAGGWLWVAVFLILCQFAMPFVFLLFRRTKDDLRRLSRIAVFLLATCFINLLWQIVPAPLPEGLAEVRRLGLGQGLDVLAAVVALVGVGGVWVAMFLWELKKMPLVPLRATGLEEAPGHG